MTGFLLRRLGQAMISLVLLTVVIFSSTNLLGDPVAGLLPMDATDGQRQAVREELGLNRPLWEQYGSFLGNLVRGDLGDSIHTRQPVINSLIARTPDSLILAGASILVAMVIAIPLGVASALRKGKLIDKLARGFAALGQAAPPFWVGLVLALVFAVRFGWLPAGGSGSVAHVILPALTLGWFISAGVLRLLRSGMGDVIDAEYVTFAKSFGMTQRRAVWTWALPNALISVVTFIGYMFGVIVAGAIVVETVFAWPGLGRLAYEAVLARDLALIQGAVIVGALIVIASNLAVDLTYGLIDPRIRVHRENAN